MSDNNSNARDSVVGAVFVEGAKGKGDTRIMEKAAPRDIWLLKVIL